MVLVTIAAIVIGSLAAFRPGGIFDRIVTFISLIGASAPDFWIAIVGIIVFAIGLGWLPTSGTGTVWHWILPIARAVHPAVRADPAGGARLDGPGLRSAYVKTARAKGVGDRSIIFVHTLRNAMLPVITVIGDQAAAILNGAVVVETIFGFPGVGKLMIDSILQRDFNVVLAAIMVTAIAIFVMNLADRHRLCAARSPHPDLTHGRRPPIDAKPMTSTPRAEPGQGALRIVLGMLWRDKFATAAVIFLLIVILCAIFGPALLGEAATKQNLRGRNAPPFSPRAAAG